ncbi:MAG: CcmD family protein [Gemmatimonadota bacterium]|jgi:CcmD family protein
MSLSKRLLRWGVSSLLALAVLAAPVLGQAMPGQAMASQTLRPYRFVFIAYAIVWMLVLGWVISVGRRLSRLGRRLDEATGS